MRSDYKKKQIKQLELYFRSLSSVCIDSVLAYYYVPYEFLKFERYLGNRVLKKGLRLWDIKDAESLKTRIRWLLEDGNRDDYKALHAELSALPEQARQNWMEASKDYPKYARMSVVQTFLLQLPAGEIAAFGGGWAIFLSRIGLAYGYLTKEEAWAIKLEAAGYVQQHYRSWEEYLIAFMAGSRFWKPEEQFANVVYIMTRGQTLLGMGTFASRKAPWDIPLEPGGERAAYRKESASLDA
ncbi:DUF1266 domain-containing protein [Paenibacillus sp. VMFN-D1]|uniref:DUF1266 domain-containing protein n=1 Tax=Paenibacillus sp. VMFN-D1 TaxID=2135608 RepID=UPI000E3A0ED6|nr:DUF1266 domain-containing protein [Paenibacillus sp. VMFN-D1]RED36852.1 uncharacterized protein DUF1266 [Paenibacillus sp. VMFN-D1]